MSTGSLICILLLLLIILVAIVIRDYVDFSFCGAGAEIFGAGAALGGASVWGIHVPGTAAEPVPESPQAKPITSAADACPDLSARDKLILNAITKTCPVATSDHAQIDAYIKLVKASQTFSDQSKQRIIERLESRQVSEKFEKPHQLSSLTAVKKAQSITIDLTSSGDKDKNESIELVNPGKKISLLSSTKLPDHKYRVRVAVVDLNNLAKYGSDPELMELVNSCSMTPLANGAVITPEGTCKRDIQIPDMPKSKYVVIAWVRGTNDVWQELFTTSEVNPTLSLSAVLTILDMKTGGGRTFTIEVLQGTNSIHPASQHSTV
jgi:hypothetical protein